LSDPHRHWHCYALNATFDSVEAIWKSGQFRQLMADSLYYQEYWHAALAEELRESGYSIRSTTRERCWKGWDLACVNDRLIDLFSKKHHQIDDLAEEREITSGAAEAILARNLRSSKDTNQFATLEEKRANWRVQAGPEWDQFARLVAKKFGAASWSALSCRAHCGCC
jgi:conjugative relaxase-like TrwC/TraI family protein